MNVKFIFGKTETWSLLCIPGCPQTSYIDKAGFEFLNIHLPLLPKFWIKNVLHHYASYSLISETSYEFMMLDLHCLV